MSTETIVALASLAVALFGGLATCLRLILQIAQLIRSNSEHIAVTTALLNGHSTKVPPEDTTIG